MVRNHLQGAGRSPGGGSPESGFTPSDARNIVQFRDRGAIDAEAAQWLARLDAGELSGEELARFCDWRARSAHHREAIDRLSGLWNALDAISGPIPAPFAGLEPAEATVAATRHRLGGRFRAGLAGLVLVVAAAVFCVAWLRGSRSQGIIYETAVGQQAPVTLADGSRLLLNTNSRIDVFFSRGRRDVRLVRGEAYFEVAHDRSRPFAVFDRDGIVRAVGTAFNVQLLNQGVDVAVTTGTVELATARPVYANQSETMPPRSAEKQLGRVTAGQDAIFAEQVQQLARVSDAELDRRLSWRHGALVYAGEPLSRVVADIERYSTIRIEILDPELRNLPVAGYFEIGKTQSLLDALASNFAVKVHWSRPDRVELSRP